MQTRAVCTPGLNPNSKSCMHAKDYCMQTTSACKFTCNKTRKFGFFFQENIYNGTRIMAFYRCFQRANLDTPHDQCKFHMQFWRMRIDSHAVSHFKELWYRYRKIWSRKKVSVSVSENLVSKKMSRYRSQKFWSRIKICREKISESSKKVA